ncbi:uncharacterized protein LOC131306649 [Rhododendron vialii]|uniref:uncharacterized protein LOC131306649 n=1 Tax=Rhododendron vialii TaxID=182163 RepID=UPI00265EC5D4|nr:uncharacterized protein LOC131306649 [Rhododendron vialii]
MASSIALRRATATAFGRILLKATSAVITPSAYTRSFATNPDNMTSSPTDDDDDDVPKYPSLVMIYDYCRLYLKNYCLFSSKLALGSTRRPIPPPPTMTRTTSLLLFKLIRNIRHCLRWKTRSKRTGL